MQQSTTSFSPFFMSKLIFQLFSSRLERRFEFSAVCLDPHIRVGGQEYGVKVAKSRILHFFETKSNRVTMKMDVSYTDHSHIIGKGGNTIRRVMAETSCHIHFPDSNRSNPNEKSNQGLRDSLCF
jgi:hypothetical protein